MAGNIELLGLLIQTSGDEILANTNGLSHSLRERLHRRPNLINTINTEYTIAARRRQRGHLPAGCGADGRCGRGEVFGEMAFFSGEPRSATVRATVDSECFVLQGADLRLLAMTRPSVLHRMGGALARRLANLNARLAAASAHHPK